MKTRKIKIISYQFPSELEQIKEDYPEIKFLFDYCIETETNVVWDRYSHTNTINCKRNCR